MHKGDEITTIEGLGTQGTAARFIGGGTTLMDLIKLNVEHPSEVIDINRLGMDTVC